MPVTQVEAQEFFQQVAAAESPEQQQALIQEYAANNDNPDEMLAAIVQSNPAAAQQIATVTAQALPEEAAEIAGAIAAAAPATATAAAALATAHCSPPYRTAGKGTPDTTQSPVNLKSRPQTQPCQNLFPSFCNTGRWHLPPLIVLLSSTF